MKSIISKCFIKKEEN